jgi:hypothetical protein
MPKRGPKCKLGYQCIFHLILWVLYTGMQWRCLPVPKDINGNPALPSRGLGTNNHPHDSGGRSYDPRGAGPRAEKHFKDLVPSEDTDKLMHGAVDQNQHNQENLDGPEMRPHDLREQLLVAGHETPGLFPEVGEVLQVVE